MAIILVVDDEQPIRQLMARLLERKGHTVIQCGDASTALQVTDAIDLLIVDLVLPGVNGRELTIRLRERQPTLPVILMSGYQPNPELVPAQPSAFIQKPMTPSMVVETVEQMLGT